MSITNLTLTRLKLITEDNAEAQTLLDILANHLNEEFDVAKCSFKVELPKDGAGQNVDAMKQAAIASTKLMPTKSTCENPSKVAREFWEKNPKMDRQTGLNKLVAMGVARGTAKTKYAQVKREQESRS